MRGAAREKDKSLPSARLVSDCLVRRDGSTTSGIFVLECDGNTYHGAATDNPRDACFASWGVRVIRACGSEINSRPRNVSALVSSIIQEWVSK